MRSINELLNLEGRTALITGASGHLGNAIAETLAELNCNLALVDIDYESLAKKSDSIAKKYDVECIAIEHDLEEVESVSLIKQQLLKRFNSIDIIVNNAAFVGTSCLEGWTTPFESQSIKVWKRAFDVNLTSIFALIQALTSTLRASGNGSIINISSIYGVIGPDMSLYENTDMGNPAAYAASKGGLIQLTKWLSTVLAPKIRVNCISPGGIWRNQPQIFVEKYSTRTPLGRMAKEEDFKGIVAYLASDLSAYMTGQNIIVDGGWTSW